MSPRVTVLMPVYNGEKYLREAIDSILNQSYSDFEYLIINDGSTDKSVEIIKSFSDKRINLIDNTNNLGQPKSYNKGIRLARGDYIAVMHADDISLPDRIKKQVEFMDKNPDIGISGTWIETFGNNREAWKTPTERAIAKYTLLFHPTISHPTAIIKKSLLINNNLFYRASYETAEDYDLWVRASVFFPIANLGEVLLLYRTHPDQVTNKFSFKQKLAIDSIRKNMLNQLGLFPDNEEFRIHTSLSEYKQFNTQEMILKTKAWLEKLNEANKKVNLFGVKSFSEYIARRWFQICREASYLGTWSLDIYFSSELSRLGHVDLWKLTKLAIRCIIKFKS